MSNSDLIAAVRSGDLETAQELLRSNIEINQQDEQGWTALSHAAGKGDLVIVKMLVENGADVLKADADQRTPYLIALAAGRADVAIYLREAENAIAGEKSPKAARKYCKAYYLRDIRKYSGWSESDMNRQSSSESGCDGKALSDKSIVYLHQDYTVTKSMWHDEDVIFNQTTSDWKNFCDRELGFNVPDDLNLIASASGA